MDGRFTEFTRLTDALGGPYTPLAGETGPTLALFVDRGSTRYYRATASRSGASTSIIAQHFAGWDGYYAPSVTLEGKTQANLDVTFAGGVGAGPWAFQWYFTPLGGAEQLITGATAGQYTIPSVGCAHRGTYRVTASDECGGAFPQSVGSKADLDVANCP
jgi:hypothetical protein